MRMEVNEVFRGKRCFEDGSEQGYRGKRDLIRMEVNKIFSGKRCYEDGSE
jgi:hypothetical protein